jgi:hypothetical protein
MPCSGLGRSPTLPTPGSATTWRPGWSPRRTGTHRGRVETAQRPHARQLSSRAPSWPRTRPSTRHPDGCRGFRKPDAVPAPARRPPPPPRYWRSQPATRRGTRPTRSAAYPAGPPAPSPARSRSVDPAGGRHPHAAAASVAPGCRGACCAFRDRSRAATTMPTIVTCKTKPPSSAATPGLSDGRGDGVRSMLVHRMPPSSSLRRVPRGTGPKCPPVQMKNLVGP